MLLFQQVTDILAGKEGQSRTDDLPDSKNVAGRVPGDRIVQLVAIDHDPPFIVHTDVVTDIGVSKANYLHIFKKAHDWWIERRSSLLCLSELPETTLRDTYNMTVCYLLTTNDHHSIVNLHERVLAELYRRNGWSALETEFEVVTTLISSKMSKINKNSLLWMMVRKLCVLMVLDKNDYGRRYETLLGRVFRSCEHHYSNYYGNYFVGWLVGVLAYKQEETALETLVHKLVAQSRKCLSDASLWTNLRRVVTGDGAEEAVKDYDLLVDDINVKYGLGLQKLCSVQKGHEKDQYDATFICSPAVSVPQPCRILVLEQLQWLLDVQCPYTTPYLCVCHDKAGYDRISHTLASSKSQELIGLLTEVLHAKKDLVTL